MVLSGVIATDRAIRSATAGVSILQRSSVEEPSSVKMMRLASAISRAFSGIVGQTHDKGELRDLPFRLQYELHRQDVSTELARKASRWRHREPDQVGGTIVHGHEASFRPQCATKWRKSRSRVISATSWSMQDWAMSASPTLALKPLLRTMRRACPARIQ
jgi:hypothetical protein